MKCMNYQVAEFVLNCCLNELLACWEYECDVNYMFPRAYVLLPCFPGSVTRLT
jgi:hypothetical protein